MLTTIVQSRGQAGGTRNSPTGVLPNPPRYLAYLLLVDSAHNAVVSPNSRNTSASLLFELFST